MTGRAISSLELAKRCGVSQGTVDRALHNRPGIAPATRERVLAAAAEYGYVPNPSAREMLLGTSRMVGGIVPALNSVFFMDLMEALRRALAKYGLGLFLTPVETAEETVAALREFAGRRLRAAALVPPLGGMRLPSGLCQALPIVTLANPLPGLPFLGPDERATGRTGTTYLQACGHRRIGHLTFPNASPGVRQRRRGYSEAMRAAGRRAHIHTGTDAAERRAWVERHRLSAVFCHNDWQALVLIRQLERGGQRVPADLSVLGVDNSPTFTSLCQEITTLQYPYEAIAGALAERIATGKETAPIPDCAVVERESVLRLS